MANDLDRKWKVALVPTAKPGIKYEHTTHGTLNQATEFTISLVQSACYEIDKVTIEKAHYDARED